MATYGYCRVSTAEQAEDGLSLDVQARQIAGYAQMLGLAVNETFVERGISGTKPLDERPEGARLLSILEPGDVVIAAKLDRMFRSALDALRILEVLRSRGVALHLIDLGGDVTGNGVAKLVFTILSAVAEAERDRIRERVMDVKRDQRARGRYLGGHRPFGFTVRDGALAPEPAEQAAIETIRELAGEGLSLRAIALAVQERHEIAISHVAVRSILARPVEEADAAG